MIDPNAITTIRVDQLSDAPFSLTDNLPHEVGQILKRGTVQNLVDLIATVLDASGGVGYLPISVVDGQQLPDVPTDASFFLCGKGTFLNVNGYPDIVCTKELNAIMSLSDHWEIAVEIPITVDPENIGIAQTVNLGVLDSAPSQDAVYKAINQYVNAVGSFHYADLASQTVPLSIVANVEKKLTNDTLGAYTDVTQAPYGVASTWDAVNSQFDFSELSVGDWIDLRTDLIIDLVGTNTNHELYIKFAIGSGEEWTLPISDAERKSTSSFVKTEYVGFNIANASTRDYPAEIYFRADVNGTVIVNGWLIGVLRKNINIVDIGDDYVSKAGNDTITGEKTFLGSVLFNRDGSTFVLPDKAIGDYTIAVTSDITGGSETTTTMGALINSAGNATPNDTDFIATAESAGLLKKITWTNAKAFLKTYYDTVYTTTGAVASQITTALSGYLTSSAAASTYEPIKGSDDNYVTDAQLVVIGNTSNTNSGDETTASLKTKIDEYLGFACSDETSNLATGLVATFRMPYAMTLSQVRINLTTAATISSFIVDVKQGGASIFSTLVSIDATELTSTTAATPAVISTTALTDDSLMTIHITQIGSGDTGKGLKLVLKGKKS